MRYQSFCERGHVDPPMLYTGYADNMLCNAAHLGDSCARRVWVARAELVEAFAAAVAFDSITAADMLHRGDFVPATRDWRRKYPP